MHEYLLTDDQGNQYTYAATDMQMALVVHERLYGTTPHKLELI